MINGVDVQRQEQIYFCTERGGAKKDIWHGIQTQDTKHNPRAEGLRSVKTLDKVSMIISGAIVGVIIGLAILSILIKNKRG